MIKTPEGYIAKLGSGYSPEYVREEAHHEKESKKSRKRSRPISEKPKGGYS